MAVKTLESLQSTVVPGAGSKARTYSIEPQPTSVPTSVVATENIYKPAVDFESFLEGENPLGCFRGVMWVMAFNTAVFVLGYMIWRSCKLFM